MKCLSIDRRILGGILLVLVTGALVGVSPLGESADSEPQAVKAAPLLVTSSLGATSAVLFVLDPESRTLAAYEAVPGTEGGLSLLGARKIDHDLRLTSYRDLSEFSHADLREQYEKGQGSGKDN